MPPKPDKKATTFVYIRDKEYAWRPAILEETKGDKAIVSVFEYKDETSMLSDGGRGSKKTNEQTVNLKEYTAQVLPLQNVDAQGQLTEFSDMVKLPYLHEPAILYNLKSRHMSGKPYTRTGDIVIACNPFQWFKELYTEKKRAYYSNRLVWEHSDTDPRDTMEPHVYEVSSLSYKGLAFGGTNQSILVSGESGAGKTETVKIAMNHMAIVQAGHKTVLAGDDESPLDPVVKKVVESNPLLEAFGNAKTRRNDNSSRFGKYLQLQFDRQKPMVGGSTGGSHCTLAGSKCDVYLLEKNRVTSHDDQERTYHIFYQLIAAPEADKARFWSGMKGTHNGSFKYIMDTHTKTIEGMTDSQHYGHTVDTLDLIDVNGAKLDTLMRAVAIVLQAGNLTFGAKGGDKDKSEITSKGEAAKLADLMGVKEQDLSDCLTERTMKTKAESYKVPLNTEFAKDSADAFAKEVYGKLFLWVVKQINIATRAEDNYKDGTMTDFGIIGLLDIFGFESFARNRFEQLCINYANEKLQQKFTEDVFQAVQIEYEAEGIALAEIQYDDNTDVLDLIEGRTGLLAMLNEECVRPKGNDKDFVNKALASNKASPCLIVNKMDNMSFGIHHYAGKVMYDAQDFVTSNQDTLPTDLEDLMKICTNEIAAQSAAEETPSDSGAASGGKRAAPKRQKSNIVGETVWGKYKTQLASLMANLRKTNSRYIRCIKPNMAKKPILLEHNPTVEQLRCAGVIAAVTLARSAFPNKLDNPSVMFRYNSMWDKSKFPSKATDSMSPAERMKANAEQCMLSALQEKICKDDNGNIIKSHIVGRTKTYYRAGVLEYLEANRADGLDGQAVTIQRFARGMIVRKQFKDRLEAGVRADREARAAREAAEKAAQEKRTREKLERDQTRKKDFVKYDDQLRLLQKQHKDADQYKESRLEELEEAKKQALADIEELRENTGSEARAKMMEPKKIFKQQKAKLEAQTVVIENLKKDSKKIRKENEKIKEKFASVKVNNDKLIKANEDAGGSFETITENAEKVSERNEELIDTLEAAKRENKELKEACMRRQEEYMTQAETRLEYQKTMARILNLIQESSKDSGVVEDTVCIALECEAEAKSVMATLEAETEDD